MNRKRRQELLMNARASVERHLNDIQMPLRRLARIADISFSQLYRFLRDPAITYGPNEAFYEKLLELDREEEKFWDPVTRRLLLILANFYKNLGL